MRPIRCVRNCRFGKGRPARGVKQIDKRLAKQNVYSLLRYLKSHVRKGALRRSIQSGGTIKFERVGIVRRRFAIAKSNPDIVCAKWSHESVTLT